MLAFSNDYYGMIFRATQSVELFCAYFQLNKSRNFPPGFIMVLHTFLTLISSKTEKPQKPYGFRGILYLNTMSSCDNKSIFRLYYSMIVATFPDPTVRPPSRYQTGVLQCANGDFSCDLRGKIRIFHCVLMVFGDFVIMVLSLHF